jgi:subtilisin
VKPDAIVLGLGTAETWVNSLCGSDYIAKKISWANRNGVVVAVAAGNTPWGISSPGCAPRAITVGASLYDKLADFSGRGYAMKRNGVIAPGVAVYSTLPGNSYGFVSGTSVATPHVAGLVALMKQKNPSLSATKIQTIIFDSTSAIDEQTIFSMDAKEYEIGHGLINVEKTLNNA